MPSSKISGNRRFLVLHQNVLTGRNFPIPFSDLSYSHDSHSFVIIAAAQLSRRMQSFVSSLERCMELLMRRCFESLCSPRGKKIVIATTLGGWGFFLFHYSDRLALITEQSIRFYIS